MNNNQLTDEKIAQWLGDACMVIGDRFSTGDELSAAKAIRALAVELQERRKAERDSEPVAWKIHTPETGVTYVETNPQSVENIRNGFGIKVEITPLYRHAQPAPVVLDENTLRIQGIEALEEFLTVTTPEPEMVGGIKLTTACCRVLKSIIKNNGWADFNGGNPEEVKAETIISALREPHSDACRAAMLNRGKS